MSAAQPELELELELELAGQLALLDVDLAPMKI